MKLVAVRIAITVMGSAAVLAASPQDSPVPVIPLPQVPELATAEVEPIARPQGVSEVVVSEFMTVDIVAQNDYVTNILQKLAIQARRNIVSSALSERFVSANLYGVPFEEALGALLRPNGLDFVEEGEFLFVYTVEELEAMDSGPYGRITREISLNYLRPEDAAGYVQSLLTPRGSVNASQDFPDGGNKDEGGSTSEGIASQLSVFSPGADEYAVRNAIVVTDVPEAVDKIEAFLKKMDTPPAQVLVEATVIQTSLSEENALGVDFALLGNENFTDFFTPVQQGFSSLGWKSEIDAATGEEIVPGLPNMNAYAMSRAGNTSTGASTITAGYVGNVGVFLRALDQVTDVTLLSNPKVMTLNRQLARVFVGERIGYFESSNSLGITTSTLQFVDTGIVLDVRPFIFADGRVRLELSPKISQVVFRETNQGVIPDESIQQITTDVLVPEGHTAVLGGLFREDNGRSKSQVPLLGDMPLIGNLFKGRDEYMRQTEVIFLIKPTVLQDKAIIADGEEASERYEDVRVGSRMGLLYWSRERHSARLNLEAERLMVRGNTYGVRFRLRRSLGLKPLQPGVIRALEKLDRKDLWLRDTSYLNDLIDEEFAQMEEESAEEGAEGGE